MPSLPPVARRVPALVALALALAACDESKLAPPAPSTATAPREAPARSPVPAPEAAPAPWQPTTAAGKAVGAVLAQRTYGGIALSPDGTRLAYQVALDPVAAPRRRAVFVVDARVRDASPERLTAGGADERSPAFSPDGRTIAFWSTSGDGGRLCIADANTRALRATVSVEGSASALAFSADGKRLAFLHAVGGGAAPRVAVMNVASGRVHAVSPPDLHVHEYATSPDGRTFAAIVSPAARPNWFAARLVAFAAGDREARVLFAPPLQLGELRFSPDGAEVAVVGGLMSDEGNTGGEIFVVPAAGGAARNVPSGRATTIASLRWMPDGRSFLVKEIADGRFAIGLVPANGGAGETFHQADALFRSVELSADGKTVAFERGSPDQGFSVWAGPPRTPAPLRATEQPFERPWGEVKSLHARSDAYSIQSYLYPPPGPEPRAKAPLVVVVHGGPAASAVAAPQDYAALAAEGWYVLLPNPRGSYGQGEAFTAANVKDFGGGDLRDIQASVRAAIAAAPIDPERVAILGWSYGGFMTMWAVTQTTQFRAAVAGAGIADWQSYYGQTDVPGWMPPYFGASVYDDPGVYAKRSPIAFVKQVKTPTLMLVGERDVDCPAPQSRQFWAALHALGVPSELVVFPGEGHGFASSEHRRERVDRIAAWFRRYLVDR